VDSITWFDNVLSCNARSKCDGFNLVNNFSSMKKKENGSCIEISGQVIDYKKVGIACQPKRNWNMPAGPDDHRLEPAR